MYACMFFSGQVRRSCIPFGTAVSEKRRVVHVCARRVSFVMDRRAIGVYETTSSVGKPYETMCWMAVSIYRRRTSAGGRREDLKNDRRRTRNYLPK